MPKIEPDGRLFFSGASYEIECPHEHGGWPEVSITLTFRMRLEDEDPGTTAALRGVAEHLMNHLIDEGVEVAEHA